MPRFFPVDRRIRPGSQALRADFSHVAKAEKINPIVELLNRVGGTTASVRMQRGNEQLRLIRDALIGIDDQIWVSGIA